MDNIELTIEQRSAQAQVEMFKNFRMIILFVMGISTFATIFGVYNSIAASEFTKDFVKIKQYEKERAIDKEAREKLNKKLDEILDSARKTREEITKINAREEMREKYSKKSNDGS